MYNWKVVPLCKEQLLDVDPKDVLPGGHFRLCDTYKSGGGYDKFSAIFEKRTKRKIDPKQFVVQLYGCHLKCPYCYVTPNGIWGKPVYYTTDGLAKVFFTTQKMYRNHFRLDTFHLMGGSPAFYMEQWPELIDRLGSDVVFHSDLCLTEKLYDREILKAISKPNCLYAVNIKGVSSKDYKRNTGSEFDLELFKYNFYDLIMYAVPFYITFTNPDMSEIDAFYEWVQDTEEYFNFMDPGWIKRPLLEDSIIIDLIDYKAAEAYEQNKKSRICPSAN